MPADDVNDALWTMKLGKCPDDEGLQALSGAGASVSSGDQKALNAIIRIVASEGISVQQQWGLVNAMEEKGLGSEEFTKMVQLYVLEDSEADPVKPSSLHIPLLFELAANMLGLDPAGENSDIVDPSVRDIDKVVEVDEGEDEEKLPCGGLKSFLDSVPWNVLTGINTAWALFAGDIALWTLEKDADYGIACVTLVVFFCFLFELVGNIISRRDYGAAPTMGEKMTMFFWMDVLGTFSLIPDFLIVFGMELGVPDQVVFARVARAARIGARLSRLTKLFRVQDGKSKFSGAFAGKEGMDMDDEPDVASQVGAKVADGISKKVVVLVIILLVAVPLFLYQFPIPTAGPKAGKEDSMRLLQSIKTTRMKDLGYCGNDQVTKTSFEVCKAKADECNSNFKNGIAGFGGGDTSAAIVASCALASGTGTCTLNSDSTDCDGDVDATACTFTAAVAAVTLSSCCAAVVPVVADNQDTASNEAVDCVEGSATPMCQEEADAYCTDTDRRFMSSAAVSAMSKFCSLSNDAVVAFTWVHNTAGTNNDDTFFNNSARIETLRKAELKMYGDYVDPDPDAEVPILHHFDGFEVWVDYKDKTSTRAGLDLVYMLVVCIIFAISSMVFMSDLNSLVIEPVEGLTKAMSMISKSLLDLGATSTEGGEATYIENSVLKIVSLLQVSFGDAGQRIIQRNMSAGADKLQMRQAGTKVNGCWGFSDIREFTGTTEALNENIVVFVNEFAMICHQCGEDGDAFLDKDKPDVYFSMMGQQGGKANKNVGDAFLIVWKEESESKADLALAAYRMAVQRIRDSDTLALLCAKPSFASRFPPQDQPFKKYFPCMGFGLHWGWAIEGAIGSELKTDAIYLGPHVDMADVLEMNTKEYKTPILMSEQFYNKLSADVQKTIRKVDRVMGGALTEPFDLYAANVANLEGNFFAPSVKEYVFKYTWQDDTKTYGDAPEVKTVNGQDAPEEITQGPLESMIDDWNDGFEEAVEQYISGDWPTATAGLQACLAERPWDGPTQKLLKFMKETPKADFKGYSTLK